MRKCYLRTLTSIMMLLFLWVLIGYYQEPAIAKDISSYEVVKVEQTEKILFIVCNIFQPLDEVESRSLVETIHAEYNRQRSKDVFIMLWMYIDRTGPSGGLYGVAFAHFVDGNLRGLAGTWDLPKP